MYDLELIMERRAVLKMSSIHFSLGTLYSSCTLPPFCETADSASPNSAKGRVTLPNRMKFRKNSKQLSTPPPFLENYIANFLWKTF